MSKFIPSSANQREVHHQVTRRLHIEKRLNKEIAELQQELKTKSSVVVQLQALGLTKKHAENLNARLTRLNQAEAKFKAKQEAKAAEQLNIDTQKEEVSVNVKSESESAGA